MVYSWQTVNVGNLAEQVCRPTDYFSFPDCVVMGESDRDFSLGPVIFGASGLLYPEIAPILEAAVSSKKYPMFAWGIGNNTHYGTTIEFPSWLSKFDLCGLRDFGSPYFYVPCPSCMNPVFDRFDNPEHDLVIYDQVDYPVKLELDVPRMNNNHPKEMLGEVIRFLASGQTILTSSYHGAYWGLLLDRRVLIWEPWSTKFLTLKPKTLFVNEDNWMLHSTVPQDNTGYLEECRQQNKEFYGKILNRL